VLNESTTKEFVSFLFSGWHTAGMDLARSNAIGRFNLVRRKCGGINVKVHMDQNKRYVRWVYTCDMLHAIYLKIN